MICANCKCTVEFVSATNDWCIDCIDEQLELDVEAWKQEYYDNQITEFNMQFIDEDEL